MKIAVISDIHGNLPALKSVWPHIKKADEILCLGDMIGYYPSANDVARMIKSDNITTLLGNHEHYLLNYDRIDRDKISPLLLKSIDKTKENVFDDVKDWISNLKPLIRLKRKNLKLLLSHGSPWRPLEEYIYPDYEGWDRFKKCDADIILLGHTHRPMVIEREGVFIINPGSVGQPRDGDKRASFAILDIDKMDFKIHRVSYNRKLAIRQAVLHNVPDKFIKDLYDVKKD